MRPITRFLATVAVLAALATSAPADEVIAWQPSLDAAQRLAAQSNRLVLIHFWAPWCQPCMNMEKNVFSQAATGQALEANFVMVKLNADDSPATAKMYQVSSLPTDVIITPGGRLLATIQSPPTAEKYVAQMNRTAEGFKQQNRGSQAGLVRSNAPANPYGNMPADPQAAGQQAAPPAAPAQQSSADRQYAEYVQQQMAGTAMQAQPAAPPAVTNPAGYGQPPMNAVAQAPAGPNPIGLEGYCPVELVEKHRWAKGDARWGANHRGRIYLFGSQEAQQRFLANPDAYSPVMQGNDPVLALDGRQLVAGRRDHGLLFESRVYLFSSEETLKQFEQNPKRYAAEIIQAMR